MQRLGACLRQLPHRLDHRIGGRRTLGDAAVQFGSLGAADRRAHRACASLQRRLVDHQRHPFRRDRKAEDAALRLAPVDDQRLLFALFGDRQRADEFRDQQPRIVDLGDGQDFRQLPLAELAVRRLRDQIDAGILAAHLEAERVAADRRACRSHRRGPTAPRACASGRTARRPATTHRTRTRSSRSRGRRARPASRTAASASACGADLKRLAWASCCCGRALLPQCLPKLRSSPDRCVVVAGLVGAAA